MAEGKDNHATPQLPANNMGCTGCGLCESVCARQAIRMEYNEEGFMRPVVDEALCTGCGACEKMCARVEQCEKPHNAVHYVDPYRRGGEKGGEGVRMTGGEGVMGILGVWESFLGFGGVLQGS